MNRNTAIKEAIKDILMLKDRGILKEELLEGILRIVFNNGRIYQLEKKS